MNQCDHHTHHESVVRTTGSRQGCTVEKMTAQATVARRNAMTVSPKPYSATNPNNIDSAATLYRRIRLELFVDNDVAGRTNCGISAKPSSLGPRKPPIPSTS